MKKAAWIRVAITVEGEAEPEQDFAKMAIDAVRASMKLAPPPEHANLKLKMTRIYEDSTPPEDQGDPDLAYTPGEDASAEETSSAPSASAEHDEPTRSSTASTETKASTSSATVSAESKASTTPPAAPSKSGTRKRANH